MQRVKLTDSSDMKLYCPFCGACVLSEEQGLVPCGHTLFIASDEGFEFVCPALKKRCEEFEYGEDSMDEFTDGIEFPESVKFALYQPPPSFFGGYFGFSREI
jgi:hypothetical protein